MSSTQQTASTKKVASSQLSESVKKSEQLLSSSRSSRVEEQKSAMASSKKQDLQMLTHSKRELKDDIIKKVADIHMSPLSRGKEMDDANDASARARVRILELERELEEITRKAMTSTSKALKTAKQMAAEATREDEAAMKSSFKKTKKVMIESSSKIV
jgi:fructose-specific phosphotransferase system component IIB